MKKKYNFGDKVTVYWIGKRCPAIFLGHTQRHRTGTDCNVIVLHWDCIKREKVTSIMRVESSKLIGGW